MSHIENVAPKLIKQLRTISDVVIDESVRNQSTWRPGDVVIYTYLLTNDELVVIYGMVLHVDYKTAPEPGMSVLWYNHTDTFIRMVERLIIKHVNPLTVIRVRFKC